MHRRLVAVAVVVVFVMQTIGTAQGKAVRATLAQAATRSLAPDFELTDVAGRAIRLSDFRGQVLLLDFWATKCGGCVAEIPMFIEVARAHYGKGLRALGVSEDIIYENLSGGSAQAWNQVKPFVRDHKIDYPVVVDDREVHRRFNITALPLTYLLDRRGRIAATYLGVVDRNNLEQNISALLAEVER